MRMCIGSRRKRRRMSRKKKREKERPCVGVLQGGRETPSARVCVSPGAGERGGRCGGRVSPGGGACRALGQSGYTRPALPVRGEGGEKDESVRLEKEKERKTRRKCWVVKIDSVKNEVSRRTKNINTHKNKSNR